eukprot:15366441-Ditylum_brightwellii.AAC.2
MRIYDLFSRRYPELVPYLKGIHHILESWRPTRDEDGWKYTLQELLAKYGIDPIWQEHEGAPEFAESVPQLETDIQALLELVSSEEPPIIIVRKTKTKFALYAFVDASGTEYGHSINCQMGSSSTMKLLKKKQELDNSKTELFLSTNNWVAENEYYKGTSSSCLLFELLVHLYKASLYGGFTLHLIHVSGTCMVAQGTDGLSRGQLMEGVMRGQGIRGGKVAPDGLWLPEHINGGTFLWVL